MSSRFKGGFAGKLTARFTKHNLAVAAKPEQLAMQAAQFPHKMKRLTAHFGFYDPQSGHIMGKDFFAPTTLKK